MNMPLFVPPNGHANKYTIPLRFGVVLEREDCHKAILEDALYDEEGTLNQTKRERDKGRKHYTGVLRIKTQSSNVDISTKIRAVVEFPFDANKKPLLVTVLGVDGTKGDNTISSFLENLAQVGKITVEDIRTVFHDAYKNDRIKSAFDVQQIYESEIQSKATVDGSQQKELQSNPEVLTEATNVPSVEDIDLKSAMTTKPLPIPGVKYEYVMANAYIENVRVENEKIFFSYIDENEELKEIHSFKMNRSNLAHLYDHAFKYFKDREEQRAIFAICMSQPCSGFLAESVTAISLQMKRAGKA